MSNEQIELILKNQAQFSRDLQKMREQFSSDIQQMLEFQAGTEQLINRLSAATMAGFQDLSEKINILVDSQIKLDAAQMKTEATITEMGERLNAFIGIVERYIEGRIK